MAVMGVLCLVAVPMGRRGVGTVPTLDLELMAGRVERGPVMHGVRVLPGQILVGGTETYPYWERENTGDPEAFADVSLPICLPRAHGFILVSPNVGCCS
jgi:hypothetical protein